MFSSLINETGHKNLKCNCLLIEDFETNFPVLFHAPMHTRVKDTENKMYQLQLAAVITLGYDIQFSPVSSVARFPSPAKS